MDINRYASWTGTSPIKKDQNQSGFNDTTPTRDSNASNDIISNLKKNYEDRIRSLEYHFKNTLNLVENDEIINTLKLNQTSDEFRKQRVLEIFEDSAHTEKEAIIERLSQSNAFLKTELMRLRDEDAKIKHYHKEEISSMQNKIEQLEVALRGSDQARDQLERDIEQTLSKLRQVGEHFDHQIKMSESKHNHEVQSLHEDLKRASREIEKHQNAALELESNLLKRNRAADEMRNDIEVLRTEYQKIEGSYQSLMADHANLTRNANALKDVNSKLDHELNNQKLQVRELESKLANMELEFLSIIRDKEDLTSKIENLQAQQKKAAENEQRNISEKIKEIKTKHKSKTKALKEKVSNLKEGIEQLTNDNQNFKHVLEERKLHYERLLSDMQNDMKTIKNEWEKKCQEIELNSQRAMAEQKAKYQIHINQLQAEYQSLLDKKLGELHAETANHLNKSRTFDNEVRSSLETRISQMERDYISKSKHENILTAEIMDIKTSQVQQIKELEEKYEHQIQVKAKELADKSRIEYETAFNSFKNANRALEDQKSELDYQNSQLRQSLEQESENNANLTNELDKSEQNRKMLMNKLNEAQINIDKLKTIYESEAKKSINLETECTRLQKQVEELHDYEDKQSGTINDAKKEISVMLKLKLEQSDKITELEAREKHTTQQQESLKSLINALTTEKEDLTAKVRGLTEELNKELQSSLDKISTIRKEEAHNVEKELEDKLRLQSSLQQAEIKLRVHASEQDELQKRIKELKSENERLEHKLSDLQEQKYTLESEVSKQEQNVQDLQAKMDRKSRAHKEILAKISKSTNQKINHLRLEVNSLKKSVGLDLQLGSQSVNQTFEDLVKLFTEKTYEMESEMIDDKKKALDNLAKEYQSTLRRLESTHNDEKSHVKQHYEKTIKSHSGSIEKVVKEFENLREENQNLLKLVERLQEDNNGLSSKIEKQEKERQIMQSLINEKSSEFESIQKFVETEIKRIKEESEIILVNSMEQVESKHLRDISRLSAHFDSFKSSNLGRLSSIHNEAQRVHRLYESEIDHIQNTFKLRIENYEKELDLLENEYVLLKREKSLVTAELEKLTRKFKELQEDKFRMLVEFEDKMETLKEVTADDTEKYSKLKAQSEADKEKYKREIKALKKELELKENKIIELDKSKDKLDMQLYKAKTQLDDKERVAEKKQPELKKTSRSRDREMEDLQAILAKSIQSFNHSIDSNIKMATKFDKEAAEVARNVKAEK